MRICAASLGSTLISILLSSCGSENVASTKFITLTGVGGELRGNYLIKDVKAERWLVHYGFSDNDRCLSSGLDDPDKFEEQIRQSILLTIDLWLQPLRELETGIVNDFNLILVDTVKYNEMSTALYLVPGDEKANIGIIFHCKEKDRTSYPPSNASPSIRIVRMHHRYKQEEKFPHNKMSDTHMFMISSMLHELGHLFGLADTYPKVIPDQQGMGGMLHTGDSEYTLGRQPLSIMGFSNLLSVVTPGLIISADDAEGIRWLYRLTHDNAAADECPEDYVIELETKGCLPRHPLIFAVRNGDVRQVNILLQENSVDINTCDQYGRNALFYAEQYKHRHGGNVMVELLQAKGAQPNSACSANDTSISLAEAEIVEVESANAETQAQDRTTSIAKPSCGTVRHPYLPNYTLLLLLLLCPVLSKVRYS